ncbi:MAG: STAS domain-containing protein [Coriobacteriales bacterium]|jgi:anti-anti-sigma factor
MGDELNITCNADGNTVTYVLEGNLSTISSPYLEDEVATLDDSVINIDVDVTNLDYISEEGFDTLQKIQNDLSARGGKLRILHPNDFLADIIDDLGLKDIFEIVE